MTCPICKKPPSTTYRPFCSKRCADVDLGRWFNESYTLPALEDDDPEGQNVAAEQDPPKLN